MTDGETPHFQACPRCGEEHPPAGNGCVVPPEHSRFQPGQSGNPGGKPKGSFSIRSALKRKLAADPNEFGTGRIADALADLLIREAIDSDRIHALIHEIEGKPTEHVERTDNRIRTVVVKPGEETPPAMP